MKSKPILELHVTNLQLVDKNTCIYHFWEGKESIFQSQP